MSESATVGGLLARARERLAGFDSARLDAEVLLCHVLDRPRAWLFAHGDDPVDEDGRSRFEALLDRRATGEPVAYLVESREFWSLPFEVTPDVLIPRPETELLVEAALRCLPADKATRAVDLGTGSGAISIAIAHERPLCEVHATEVHEAALAVARRNGERLAPGRVIFHLGSWLEPLSGRFDVIVSNPPYVAADDPHLSEGDCRYEPAGALTPGGDGLAAIREIASNALEYLEPGGWLLLEHGHDQGAAVRGMLENDGYREIATLRDLAGLDRVTGGCR
jgi:release factor glutamine methyltransferase